MKLDYAIETITGKEYDFDNEHIEYWIILSGMGRIVSSSLDRDFNTHDLIQIPENCKGKISLMSSSLMIGKITISDYHYGNNKIQYTSASFTEYIRKAFSFIIDIKGLDNPNYKGIYDSLDHVMFLLLVFAGLSKSNENPVVYQVIETVNANFKDPDFDVMTVIDQTGYSKSHFRKIFKDTVSVSPITFVNNMRLDYACAHAKGDPDMTIKEIALKCGFKDPLYFTRLFKKRYGITPSEYINQNLEFSTGFSDF